MKKKIILLLTLGIMAMQFSSCIIREHDGYHHYHHHHHHHHDEEIIVR